MKLGGVITRLKSTGRRIDNYLNGKVSRLEELEETRLPYLLMKWISVKTVGIGLSADVI